MIPEIEENVLSYIYVKYSVKKIYIDLRKLINQSFPIQNWNLHPWDECQFHINSAEVVVNLGQLMWKWLRHFVTQRWFYISRRSGRNIPFYFFVHIFILQKNFFRPDPSLSLAKSFMAQLRVSIDQIDCVLVTWR